MGWAANWMPQLIKNITITQKPPMFASIPKSEKQLRLLARNVLSSSIVSKRATPEFDRIFFSEIKELPS
jgi:hypothetical protein